MVTAATIEAAERANLVDIAEYLREQFGPAEGGGGGGAGGGDNEEPLALPMVASDHEQLKLEVGSTVTTTPPP